MKKQFVTYEIALKLKELGFDEPCLSVFARNLNFDLTMFGQRFDNKIETSKDFADDIQSEDVLCPLWQQCIDWFREKYNYYIFINPADCYVITKKNRGKSEHPIVSEKFESYHIAREAAILKAITLISK